MLQRDDPQPGDSSETHFSESRNRLERVTESLRPGYGFAFHELGRLHRVWEKWDEANAYLQQALQIAVEYRDVSDSRIQEQLNRVADRDHSYP